MKKDKVDPIVENRFTYKGYPCVVIFQTMFHRCGYVGLPKGHKYYGKDYGEINDIECHGGLTYSNDSLFGQDDKDTWWIGFDCSHNRDGKDYESAKKYWKDNPDMIAKIAWNKTIDEGFNEEDYPARSLGYVEGECQHIVDQLERGNMDLNEAIEHALNVYNKDSCSECGLEHKMLAYWLQELRVRRENHPYIKAYREFSSADGCYLCSQCGRMCDANDEYCVSCGAKLEWKIP